MQSSEKKLQWPPVKDLIRKKTAKSIHSNLSDLAFDYLSYLLVGYSERNTASLRYTDTELLAPYRTDSSGQRQFIFRRANFCKEFGCEVKRAPFLSSFTYSMQI